MPQGANINSGLVAMSFSPNEEYFVAAASNSPEIAVWRLRC
jgi:hypothetical protein